MHRWLSERYEGANIGKDIIAGMIVALVSIPISMGYAQIAGVPPIHGLYGSLLPILGFGLISSSKQFVVGVDAMPAAMVGTMMAQFGIAAGSDTALQLVPCMAFLTALWLLLFYFLKAGRIVNYVSSPVMGGFISGVGVSIILMQIPKLYGGTPGTGEFFELIANIYRTLGRFHPLSAILGGSTMVLILVAKKVYPKFPVPVVLMIVGCILTAVFHVDDAGVAILPQVKGGLPKLSLPDFRTLTTGCMDIVMESLMIALVVMAQSLLTTGNYAMKYGRKVNNNREILGYSFANMLSGLSGACPINGSVSRTSMADQYGCTSQLMSLFAAVFMGLVLLFGTGLLVYLPVPILTGIVLSALVGIIDFKMAFRLWKENRNELFIFLMALSGVLIFGTIYGVAIGVFLSFCEVVVRAVIPPRAYEGMIPGHTDFYSLSRNKRARAIRQVVIYRFSGNLFFANINTFTEDIEQAIKEDTRAVIVDARGIGNIDITAADRLVVLRRMLKERNVGFYITEHGGNLNDQLRKYGAGVLIEEGCVRRTISLALRDMQIDKPYPLEGEEHAVEDFMEADERLAEFEWAFGVAAEDHLRKIAKELYEHLNSHAGESLDQAEAEISFGKIGYYDEETVLDYLEQYLLDDSRKMQKIDQRYEKLEEQLVKRRKLVEHKLLEINPRALELLRKKHEKTEDGKK